MTLNPISGSAVIHGASTCEFRSTACCATSVKSSSGLKRQAIVTKHAGRAGHQNTVVDILKELGGLAAPTVEVDETVNRNELEAIDKKEGIPFLRAAK